MMEQDKERSMGDFFRVEAASQTARARKSTPKDDSRFVTQSKAL